MRTRVFAYKGLVGIESDFKAEGLINDPSQPGQLGFIVDIAHVDVSPEAFELLKKIQKSGDDIGDVMIDERSFNWLGGPLMVLSNKSEGDNTYSAEVVAKVITPNDTVVVPQEFIDMVDSMNPTEVEAAAIK